MPEELHLADFAAHLHTAFRVVLGDEQAPELELAAAEDLGTTRWQERFSLLFRGPPETFLPQRIYRVEHAQLGTLELFLVPIGQTPDAYTYQAVFNRLLSRGS